MTTSKTLRFPGWTPERWEAEKKKRGMTDKQLYDICKVIAQGNVHSQQAVRFYGRRSTTSRAMN